MAEEEKLLKDAKELPWKDRLMHENWKVRKEANIDVGAICSVAEPKEPGLHQFGPLFKDAVSDPNALVREVALDALTAYLNHVDTGEARRYAPEICDAIFANCFTGGLDMIQKSQELCMRCVELGAVEVFLDATEKAIKNKEDTSVRVVDMTCEALRRFGAMKVPPKRILKMLAGLFDHEDANIHVSAKDLTLELCNRIEIERLKSRMSEEDKVPEQEATYEVEGSDSKESAADAPLESDDPVDILAPLKNTRFWNGVKAAEWSERKAAVAELTKLALTKRIAPGDFTEICQALKELITDVNVAVAVEAVQAIGNLAGGLRNHFSGTSRLLLPVLLEKLNEEKSSLTEALNQTLQTMQKSECLDLAHVLEEASDAAFSALPAVIKLVGMSPSDDIFERLDEDRRKKLLETFWSRSISLESLRSVVRYFGITSSFLIEGGAGNIFQGFHILSNHDILPRKPVSFNILTRGEGAGVALFMHSLGDLMGFYNFVLEEHQLSVVIVPRIPLTSVLEGIKAGFQMDIFALDPLQKKAIEIAPAFKTFLRKLRYPLHKVLSKYGRYHGNILEGTRITDSGEIILCLPKQSYESANGMLKDIRELRDLITRVVTSCQQHFTSHTDYPEDLKCFFFLCDSLEKDISGGVVLDPEVIWDYAYYILHSPIFMEKEDICNFYTKFWSIRGLNYKPFDSKLNVAVPHWMQSFNADILLSSAVSRIPGASTSTIIPSQGTTSSALPLQQPSSTTLTGSAKAFVPSRPAPPLQQLSSSSLSARAPAFVPPCPTPPLQQPSTTTLSASAHVFVPAQRTLPLQHPATTTLSGSARVFVPPQPTPPPQQPSSATALVPPRPTPPLQQPSSATALVPPQPTPPLQQPSSAGPTTPLQQTPPLQPPSAQTPMYSHGGLFLRSCRNTLAHHHQNVWNATRSVGTDELDAVEHIQAAVPEGVSLLYRWMVENLRGPTPTSCTLFAKPLQYILNSAPYKLCTFCEQQWGCH